MSISEQLKKWALANTDFFFAGLRTLNPIVEVGDVTVITRYRDVVEVLGLPEVFGVTYADKMIALTGGENFYLGMDNTPQYEQDVSLMRLAMRRKDLDTVKTIADQAAKQHAQALPGGTVDLVNGLFKLVPQHFCAQYLGVAPVKSNGVSETTDWITNLFGYLFFPDNSKEDDEQSLAMAAKARDWLDQAIQQRKAGAANDDVLGRLLMLQASGEEGTSDVAIRNLLLGNIIGALPTTAKCACLVLEYLLDHPKLLAQAQTAANNNDDTLLNQFVMESLRFNLFSPGIGRITLADYTVGGGTRDATLIEKGSKVLVATSSAMHDPRELENPEEFRLDRPADHYLHFGFGLHRCSGYYINQVQIAVMLKAALLLPGLRRANGHAHSESDGRWPKHLWVSIDR